MWFGRGRHVGFPTFLAIQDSVHQWIVDTIAAPLRESPRLSPNARRPSPEAYAMSSQTASRRATTNAGVGVRFGDRSAERAPDSSRARAFGIRFLNKDVDADERRMIGIPLIAPALGKNIGRWRDLAPVHISSRNDVKTGIAK